VKIPPPTRAGLVGRHAELGAVTRFLRALRKGSWDDWGSAPAILIQGPPGIGKTALWLTAVEQAQSLGIRVLRARPTAAETSFAYAGLHDLLRDAWPAMREQLPDAHRRAVEIALGLSDGGDAGVEASVVQAAVTHGALSLATGSPLLLAVDDAPWLDLPTAAVLRFLARRVGSHPMGFIVTQRADEDAPAPLDLDIAFPGHTSHRIWLEPLGVESLPTLIDRQLGMTVARPHVVKLYELSGGVPFHVLELARALRRTPTPAIGEHLPIPVSMRELLAQRMMRLVPAAQQALLLVAAAGSLPLRAAESLLGAAPARQGISEAIDEGLLRLEDHLLSPAHPLIASTAYELAGPRLRREAHERLYAVTEEPEIRARHRALAGHGPDEQVAAQLEAAATRARDRGAPETAAELLRLARDRTPEQERDSHHRRTLALAAAVADAADLPAAAMLLDKLIPQLTDRRMVEALIRRAEIAWNMGTYRDALQLLESGLTAVAGHPDLAADLHFRLAVYIDFDVARALDHARTAVSLLEPLDRPRELAAALMQQFYAEVMSGLAPREDLLRRGLEMEPPDNPWTTTPGLWWIALDRADDARHRYQAMLTRARARGELSEESDLLTRLATVELYADRFALAREYADAATLAARQQGNETADPARRVRALVDAHQGRLEEARAIAEPAAARAAAEDPILALAWNVVRGFVAMSSGDYAQVERVVADSAAHQAAIGAVEPLRLGVDHELPEALVALSRLDEAAHALQRIEQRQARIPRPWLASAIVRGRALLALASGDAAGAAQITEAVSDPTASTWRRFDRARTLLVRGTVLRRSRARRDAADALDEAVSIFDELGSPTWAGLARRQSDRLGRRRPGTPQLTPPERQVAELAATGLTNREVAARLSLSPKTIESHLARVYDKLGIRSRAELGRAMSSPPGNHLM
jgi:DNA-binding CsgD family transcriptional regulator/DNA polymerase III delta prime subunit